MPRNALAQQYDNALMEHRPFTPPSVSVNPAKLQAVAAMLGPIPGLGDVAGLAADAAMYAKQPESRNWKNYLLSAAGLVPIIPGVSGLRALSGASALKKLKSTELAEALAQRGFKTVKKSGRFIGAPEWIKTPEDVMLAAEQYASRVERALDAGVNPDYFYRQGESAIREITDNAKAAKEFAETVAITSSEAPVRTNVGWSIKAFDQRAAGLPIHTGMRPIEASGTITDMFAGTDPHLGIKRHRYGQGLSGIGRQMPDDLRRAPNDRFEIRSLNYDKDTASEQQHYFIDRVRQIARELVNERRGTDLDIYNTQELNWATKRADDMGISIPKAAADNVQDSLDYYTFQHSWESKPGAAFGHNEGIDPAGHHAAVKNALIDEQGKDNLVRTFGGDLQRPALSDVPGVFEGSVHPFGMQSRSLAFHSGGELDPAAAARIQDTELVRNYLLGQDAGAGSNMLPSKLKSTPPYRGGLSYNTGHPLTMNEANRVNSILAQSFNPSDYGIVPTPTGARILATPAPVVKSAKEIGDALGVSGAIGEFGGLSFYKEMPWKTGQPGTTAFVLNNLSPAGKRHADTDEMRLLAGRMAQIWSDAEKSGKVLPGNYTEVLKTWSSRGLAGVEEMVKKGIAPAVALGLLVQHERQRRPEG